MNGSLISAIRGPVLLITLGGLLALDQMGPVSFTRTWPALLIVFGLFKLAETWGGNRGAGGPAVTNPTGTNPAGTSPAGTNSGGYQS
jgi:hypothetical protein